jgi:gluconokinase
MGVAGAGKTTVGQALAKSLGWAFHDADDFHPAANVEKMRQAVPLSDADRTPWLRALHDLIERLIASGTPAVLACSALRQTYRDSLVPSGPSRSAVQLVQLDVSPSLAEQRLSARRGHYMPATLVTSQFATLEEPLGVLRVDASLPVNEIVVRIRQTLGMEGVAGHDRSH